MQLIRLKEFYFSIKNIQPYFKCVSMNQFVCLALCRATGFPYSLVSWIFSYAWSAEDCQNAEKLISSFAPSE